MGSDDYYPWNRAASAVRINLRRSATERLAAFLTKHRGMFMKTLATAAFLSAFLMGQSALAKFKITIIEYEDDLVAASSPEVGNPPSLEGEATVDARETERTNIRSILDNADDSNQE